MKKKFLLTILTLILSVTLFAQTPVKTIRVISATTAIGENIPVGTQVYDVATYKLYVATSGVISTATLTSAASSFKLVNGNGTTNLSEGTTTTTTVNVNSSTGTSATLQSASTSRAGLLSTAKLNAINTNTATNTVQGDTLVAQNARILANKASAATNATNISTNASGISTNATNVANNTTNISTNTGNISTNTSNISTNTTNVATNATNISTNTGNISTNTSNISTNTSKLATIETGAQVNLLTYQDVFSEASSSATSHTLTKTANTSYAPNVSLNGQILPASDYVFTTTTITVSIPVSQYDKLVINYHY